MIILNSFVTPLSVRRETLQKKFPFSSPFFMFWGVCTFSSNCCFVSCALFCIVVLHVVTCVVFCIVVLHIVTCVLFAIVVLHVVTCVVFCIVVLHIVTCVVFWIVVLHVDTCVVFCIVVLHIVTCVLPPVYLELWNFSEEFVDVSQSASSGILQYSGNLSFSWLNGILKRYYNIVGNISSSPRRLVFEKPAVTIEHRLLQFLHIANLTRRGNLIFNQHRKTKNPNILPSTTTWLHLPWNPVCWDKNLCFFIIIVSFISKQKSI